MTKPDHPDSHAASAMPHPGSVSLAPIADLRHGRLGAWPWLCGLTVLVAAACTRPNESLVAPRPPSPPDAAAPADIEPPDAAPDATFALDARTEPTDAAWDAEPDAHTDIEPPPASPSSQRPRFRWTVGPSGAGAVTTPHTSSNDRHRLRGGFR